MRRSLGHYQKLGVIGAPMRHGQRKLGVEKGPGLLRAANLLHDLSGIQVEDHGDVNCTGNPDINVQANIRNWATVVACNRRLSDKVSEVLHNGPCVVLGGDHCIGMGSVDGHVRSHPEVALLWVDAHVDINTPDSSPSGNAHGMPVSLLVKELRPEWPILPDLDWHRARLNLNRVAYIGLRSVDAYERSVLEHHNVAAYAMDDIDRYGIDNVVNMALNRIDPHSKASLHVSFDIDSLDISEAPSTGTAVRGGLQLREAIQLMEIVHRTGRLNVLDMVEVNPSLGSADDVHVTVEAAKQIILTAFGHKRQGFTQ